MWEWDDTATAVSRDAREAIVEERAALDNKIVYPVKTADVTAGPRGHRIHPSDRIYLYSGGTPHTKITVNTSRV